MTRPLARAVDVGGAGSRVVRIGGGAPLALIAGPCAIESEGFVVDVAGRLAELCDDLGLPLVFKGSYDKANRTSASGYRGIGLEEGVAALAAVTRATGLPTVTDVHESHQCAAVAESVHLLQIPAFLCRQTDLLVAAGATGRPVNVKKGQFLAPGDLLHAAEKVASGGGGGVLLTERGTTFGYGDLVVDMRGLPTMASAGHPVVFDATHSVQQPGALGGRSGGQRRFVPHLARAAVAIGVDALFMEVHPDPDAAPSDGPNMVPLGRLRELLEQLLALDEVARRHPTTEL